MIGQFIAGLRSGEGEETDRWLLLITLLLLGFGLVMVLSASSVLSLDRYGTPYHFFLLQALYAGMGLFAMFVFRHLDYRRLHRWAPVIAAVVAALNLAVLLPGVGTDLQTGARRWLNLGPLGTLQPSELGKLAFAIFLAQWLDRRQDRVLSFSDTFVPFLVMIAAALGVLMLQRDLGTATITCAIFVAVYFAGGGRKRDLALLLAGLLVAFALFATMESYRTHRIHAWLDPFSDPLGTTYQDVQALIGLGSGGLWGVGLGHSMSKYLWLPEAHSDFIFAIIGEETGLLGTTAVLAGFVFLAGRGYRTAIHAPDRFGVMLAAGITTWISFQALLNMATVSSTLPTTGVPLPFISAGGTALTITLAAMGILLNIAAQGQGPEPANHKRRIDATADLGRRNWRAPFASSGRGPGVPR